MILIVLLQEWSIKFYMLELQTSLTIEEVKIYDEMRVT